MKEGVWYAEHKGGKNMMQVYWSHVAKQPDMPLCDTEHRAGLSLLSAGLAALYGRSVPPAQLPMLLAKGPYGKPFLRDAFNIDFSISHCGGLVVCAFANRPLGVDVEKIGPFLPSLTTKALSPEERELLDSRVPADGRARQELFFRLWTLKEALIKQTGQGLSRELTGISFRLDADLPTGMIGCSVPGLFFYQELWQEDYMISACAPSPIDGFVFTNCALDG